MRISGFNPYQAPAGPSADASLAPDTAFLFNDKVVAGTGTIVLPRVCVVTGSTDSLLARESSLSWCPRWITVFRTVLIFASLFVGMPMLMNRPPIAPGLRTAAEIAALLQLAIGAGMILGAVILVIASYVVRTQIQVHWFISRRAEARALYFVWFFVVIVIVASIAMMRWGSIPGSGITLILVPIVALIAFIRQWVRGTPVLFVADKVDGLFLIGGLSEKFLAKTQLMADRYKASTGS